MSSLRKKFAHMRNKHLDEGTLRNALLEIKEVSKPWGHVIKQQAAANKQLEVWGEAQSLQALTDFIKSITELEGEFNDAISHYLDGYTDYYQRWKDILSERKELKRLTDEHKKAEGAVESARNKLQSAEKAEAKQRSRQATKENSAMTVTVTMVPIRETAAQANPTSQEDAFAAVAAAAAEVAANKAARDESVSPRPIEVMPVSGSLAAPISSGGASPASATSPAFAPSPVPAADPANDQLFAPIVAPVMAPVPAGQVDEAEKRRMTFGKKPASVEAAIENLKTAEDEEKALAEQVEAKTLEVQKDIHSLLRTAFYNLSAARMGLFKHGADIAERELSLTCTIPDVIGLDEDGFVTQPFADRLGPLIGTQWHHGDMLQRALEIERESARSAVEAEAATRMSEVERLLKEAKAMEGQLQHKFSDLEREHSELVVSLKTAAEQKEVSLQDQVARLTMENYTLTEEMRLMQENVLKLVLASAATGIDDAVRGVDEDAVSFFCARLDAAMNDCRELRSQNTLEKVIAAVRVTDLDRSVTASVLSALSVGFAMPSGETSKLFPLAKEAALAAQRVSDTFIKSMDPTSFKQATVSLTPLHSQCEELSDVLRKMRDFGESLLTVKELPEQISKSVSAAKQSILDAQSLLERLLSESKENDRDRVLEVNQTLLFTSVSLMKHANDVIDSALQMRTDVEFSTGTGANEMRTFTTFWRDGLQTAVNNVVDNLPVWLECTRAVVKDRNKFEELQVSTKNIAACSAQLVALARTRKSDTVLRGIGFDNKLQIESSTDCLISTSHTLAVNIREAQNLQLAAIMLEDYTKLNEVQANRLIMASQVETLRLEAALDREREKLGRLRRLNYEDMSKGSALKPPMIFAPNAV